MDAKGKLLSFVGNTVVFLLDDGAKEHQFHLQEELYRSAPDMLAKPLQMSTSRMILHNLANGIPVCRGWMTICVIRRKRQFWLSELEKTEQDFDLS